MSSLPYILAYFRQHYGTRVEVDAHGKISEVQLEGAAFQSEYLHLAWSRDGRHWSALNNNKPIFDVWMRDPFINRGPDGLFHLVATGGGKKRNCLYGVSPDLISWETRAIPLMESVAQANNIWAPEWFWDETTDEYFVFWSSSFAAHGWQQSRLWSCRTRDWQTFSAPRVMFEPPYSVIDGTLWKRDETYYLFHKEEEFGARTGERRAIRLATATALDGPWQIHDGPLNGGQIVPVITEGPAILPDPQSAPKDAGWLLLYDYCMSNDYGLSRSDDLVNWQTETEVSFPDGARHGSVFSVSEAELARLQNSGTLIAIARADAQRPGAR